MKISFKNKDIKNPSDLKEVLSKSLEEAMDESVAFMAEQTQRNAPVTKNEVDLADSVKVMKIKNGSTINYKIKVDHSSAFRYHEDPDIKRELINRTSAEKVLGSETGGVGNKFIQRAVYGSKNKVLDFIQEHVLSKIRNKTNTRQLTTKTLDDFE